MNIQELIDKYSAYLKPGAITPICHPRNNKCYETAMDAAALAQALESQTRLLEEAREVIGKMKSTGHHDNCYKSLSHPNSRPCSCHVSIARVFLKKLEGE